MELQLAMDALFSGILSAGSWSCDLVGWIGMKVGWLLIHPLYLIAHTSQYFSRLLLLDRWVCGPPGSNSKRLFSWFIFTLWFSWRL